MGFTMAKSRTISELEQIFIESYNFKWKKDQLEIHKNKFKHRYKNE